ncbi:virulence factor [Candidatus Kinetoplastibacterium desouzaii TCC079E]|uniref:Probable lipid II flippase MurJ n=1 Tax=Candidatus Kinetoplastidibacterium desouzai TCC079E TaxID=1208919 RepID=M1M3L8_9PROT|nr:murein biosynthesis integral membrane protein MurJ [Candidatus Kinetoplastibacterium desouzaii]AGF46840.1 virulence factor [Candidatus Kinetoplastibacterium desouzaii TCC079E]
MRKKGILYSILTVSFFTLLSKITGLARDIFIARTIGANYISDSFWIAFRVPNALRKIFAEGAFSQAFIPIINSVRNKDSIKYTATKDLINKITIILLVSVIIITTIGIITSPLIIKTIASGICDQTKNSKQFAYTVTMTRIMFPYVILISFTSLASNILNTWKIFSIPAFTPAILNISMIISCVLFSQYLEKPIFALSIGVITGGIIQLSIQWVAIIKIGLAPKLSTNFIVAWNDINVKKTITKMIPAIIGMSASQISILINTNIATWLENGSLTWLAFSDRITELPISLLGMALSTVMLPELSKSFSNKNYIQYNKLLNNGLKIVIIFAVPSAICMATLPTGLVTTLFHYGQFNEIDVHKTKYAVMAYSIGLVGMMSSKLLSSAFYSTQNTLTPAKISLFVLLISQILNLITVPIYKHVGLALSLSIGALVNSIIMLIILINTKVFNYYENKWGVFLLRLIPASLVISLLFNYCDSRIDWIGLQTNFIFRFILFIAIISLGMLLYTFLLFLFGMRLKDFIKVTYIK